MFERRGVLRSAFGLLAGTTLPAGAGAPPEASSGMKHRRYTGTLLYLGDEKTEVGREQFTATIQPTGLRTLRVLCELVTGPR